MSYAESLLADGERILRREHQHWFVLAWNARLALLGLVLGVVLLVLGGDGGGQAAGGADLLRAVALVLLAAGAVLFAWGWLRYRNETYLITTRRIVHVEGVVNKRTTDSSLEKINDAVLTETLFGRVFGFGDLDVLTAAESGIERLRMLRDAKAFKKAMLDAKHALEGGDRTAVGTSVGEIEAALERLAALRDRGVVTAEDYEAKKRELLARL